MPEKGFTHLHLHSQYSLLDGAIKFGKLFDRCKELGMDAVAVTDHGNIFGAVEFYTKAVAAQIKPIIGIEAYIAPGSRLDKSKTSISDAAYHLILLAENNAGYSNLLKLASIGYLEGFYYRPRIDKEVLAQHHEGLICTTACIKGEVTAAAAKGDMDAARRIAEEYLKIFGPERFFIELQRHKDDDPQVCERLIDLAKQLGVGLVATNDVHFLKQDDYEAHKCLCAIGTGKHADDPDRLVYPPDVYLKSADEMRADVPAGAGGVRQHAGHRRAVPRGDRPQDPSRPAVQALGRLDAGRLPDPAGSGRGGGTLRLHHGSGQRANGARAGSHRGQGLRQLLPDRVGFLQLRPQNGISRSGPGAAASARSSGYCLGLCDVDPIRYGLLFERFMDPARSEMPDIDIDICQDGTRPEVIEYVRKKYGHVAQIITFGTLKAKAVDPRRRPRAGRAAGGGRPARQADPGALKMTLDKALETEPELKQSYDDDAQITRKVIDIGQQARRAWPATRRCTRPAWSSRTSRWTNFVPLYKPPGTDDVITQCDGPMVEKVGLLKMDFLGLQTLTVLERARSLVQRHARRRPRPREGRPRRTRRSSPSSARARPRACSSLNPAACRTS